MHVHTLGWHHMNGKASHFTGHPIVCSKKFPDSYKETIKAQQSTESTDNEWIPHTKASNMETMSMSWSNHFSALCCCASWWRHQMETFSAKLAICAGNSPVPGEFTAQRPVTRSFDVFFDLRLNKRLSKQSWGWWFETLSRPLLRHCNVYHQLLWIYEIRLPISVSVVSLVYDCLSSTEGAGVGLTSSISPNFQFCFQNNQNADYLLNFTLIFDRHHSSLKSRCIVDNH